MSAARSRRRRTRREPSRRRRIVRRVLLGALLVLAVRELWFLGRVLRLRSSDPQQTAMMLERIEVRGGDMEIEHQWRPLDEISPRLVRAVIAGEDIHFPEHGGLDWSAIRQAASRNREQGRVVAGGSTITQQLAKNLFLSSQQSYRRKAREAVYAYELEWLLGKRRIMELYLNVIEWDEGVYGAEAAARHYFGRSAKNLSTYQAAYLAAIIPGPRDALNPRKNPKRHRASRQRIQRGMRLVDDSPLR